MKRTVVLSCFSGNGMLLLLLLLFFGIAAVPTPKPTQIIPEIITTTARASSSSSSYYTTTTGDTGTTTVISVVTTTQLPNNISLLSTDLPQGSNNEDPPAIINNENVTETEIVITEARHGKSLHHHHVNQQDLITKNDSGNSDSSPQDVTTTTERTASASSNSDFTAKLATTEGDDEVQQLGEGDASPAPPKLDGEGDPDAKPQELTEPRLQFVPPPDTVPTEKDKVIQRIFGGKCDFEHWNRCSRIDFWGGDYLVPDKHNPGKFIVKHHKVRCLETPKHTLCLRNGWTVARCHMLCMSQCNVDFRMNYESLVSHEGDCRLPILT